MRCGVTFFILKRFPYWFGRAVFPEIPPNEKRAKKIFRKTGAAHPCGRPPKNRPRLWGIHKNEGRPFPEPNFQSGLFHFLKKNDVPDSLGEEPASVWVFQKKHYFNTTSGENLHYYFLIISELQFLSERWEVRSLEKIRVAFF